MVRIVIIFCCLGLVLCGFENGCCGEELVMFCEVNVMMMMMLMMMLLLRFLVVVMKDVFVVN